MLVLGRAGTPDYLDEGRADMGALKYGVLKGTVTGHLRDADDDHYQILVNAGGVMHRIAVNVHSSLSPPDLKFQMLTALPKALRDGLGACKIGFSPVKSQPNGIAQDFVRGGVVDPAAFKIVPGNLPGVRNDLKDFLEDSVIASVEEKGALIYAFGARWGPETKADQYFKFIPGNGVHDIHMNQGNDRGHAGDDGVYHDGCLFFYSPKDDAWTGYFMAFQSQTFDTDAVTGHARGADGGPQVPPRKPPRGKKKPHKNPKKKPKRRKTPRTPRRHG
jgi:uncharacterized protein YukJ